MDTSDDTLTEDVSNKGRKIDELDKDEGAALMNEKEETEEVRDNTGDAQVEGRQADIYQIDMDYAAKVLSMQEDESEVQEAVESMQEDESEVHEAVEVVITAKLITEVIAAVSKTVSDAAVVPTITAAPVKTPIGTKSNDKGKGIMVEEPKPMKKKQQLELDEALDYFKGMSYDDIRPIFEAKFNENMEFLLKSKEYIEEEANKAIESINKTLAQKAAKRKRRNEEIKDVAKIKQHLEIMSDEDDDVYTEATPLARKVPVVDDQIVHFNNKLHYKIIRDDGRHQLETSSGRAERDIIGANKVHQTTASRRPT
uniref:Uncharacterized protein n=1 Tax=Tanacetum cinerariifolium TaxID=118510 RepID=A0A6L2KP65_TANCI|nr:hypothetical protein [Tanacetum cinerariifolium]